MKNLKQTLLIIITVIYDFLTLFYDYALIKSFIYNFIQLTLGNGNPNIAIIGGADASYTLRYIFSTILSENFFYFLVPFLFLEISNQAAFLLTFSLFKKHTNHKFGVLLCIALLLTLNVFIMVPHGTYIIGIYALTRKLPILQYAANFYIMVISAAIIMVNILYTCKNNSNPLSD